MRRNKALRLAGRAGRLSQLPVSRSIVLRVNAAIGFGGTSFDTTGAKRRLHAVTNQFGFISTIGYTGRTGSFHPERPWVHLDPGL